MKMYEPKQMVASSRYQNYFPTLPAELQQDVYSRMNKLLMEEKEYCDKGNYAHMSQILTSIALHEVLQKHGYSEAEAYRIVSKEMWKFLDPSGIQKLARKSFFLPLMKTKPYAAFELVGLTALLQEAISPSQRDIKRYRRLMICC